MKRHLLFKSLLLLCALVVGTNAWADSYTITFAKDSGDGTSASTSTPCSTIVSDGASYLSGNLVTATKVYYGGSAGLKLGASSNAGVLKMNLANNVKPTSIVVNAKLYNSTKAATIAVNSKTAQSLGENFDNYTFAFDGDTEISFIQLNSSKYCWVSSVTVNYTASGTTAAPTITGNTPFYGSTTATITNAASANGATIYYTMDGSDPTTTTSATCFAYTDAFSINATTTVKAIAKKLADTNASSVVSKTFTKVTPMTVDEALTAISALANNGTIENQCVRGIVTKVSSLYNNTAINYTISDDIAGSNELTVYRGKNMHNTDFAALSDIKLGDDVVIYGTLKKYNTTPEFDQGSYLLYQVSKDAPTFTLSTDAVILSMGTTETVDVTLTTNTDGAITCESDEEDVATVALKSAGVYTITGRTAGAATITIKSALTENYQPASATVAITVNDTREEAGLSFAEDAEEITWGDAYTGQALTNAHSLPVTWSSTDETVATVSSSGVVDVLKAGSTDIKASFAGNATYKSTVVAYTLTVKQAEAGLSYSQTEFEIMVGDGSFVAPTLNNPNNLTVAYTSSNETVALVDENTGELAYNENTPGTAIITAYFAGNDNYKGGNAKYTINIVDPTVKGSKYNPYTVAEVIDGTATGSGIYVTGFIVGEYVGKTTAPRTSGFSGNSNLAVADPFTSSPTASGSIPVQLGAAALQNAWGCKKTGGALLGYEVLIKGNAEDYFSTKGIKGTSEITAVSVPVTPGHAKITYVTPQKMDFSEVSGLKAYVATDAASSGVTMTRVETVPENTPLLLIGTASTTYNVPVAASATAPATNYLVKGDGTTDMSGVDGYNYILFSDGLFYKVNSGTIATTKAYLHLENDPTAGGARGLDIVIDDDVTAIETVKAEKANNEYYNLAGQRVAQPTKGLYIVNGRKVVVK